MRLIATVYLFGMIATAAAAAPPDAHVIQGATVIRAPGDTLHDAAIVIRDGRIEAVGRSLRLPDDARLWDASGLWAYAGLIDIAADTGLPEASPHSPRGSDDAHPSMRAADRAADAFLIEDESRRAWWEAGFTALCLTPSEGAFRGWSSLVVLGGGEPRAQILEPEVAQVLAFDYGGDDGDRYPGSLMGAIAYTRQTLLDAAHHNAGWSAWEQRPDRNRRPEANRDLEALQPVLRADRPLLMEASGPLGALRAARVAQEAGVPFQILANGHEYRFLHEVAALGVPMVVPVDFPERPPVDELDEHELLGVSLGTLRHWAHAPSNPSRLVEAGVSIALTARGLDGPGDFWEALRHALEAGLTHEQALAALTTDAARTCGLDQRLGQLSPGWDAHIVLTDGPIFEKDTRVRAVWVDGRHHWVSDSDSDAPAPEPSEEDLDEAQSSADSDSDIPPAPPQVPEGPYATPEVTLFRDATVWTMGDRGILQQTDVLVRRGRISAIGPKLIAPDDAHVVDANGMHLTPGLVDCHSHTAIEGRVNEGTQAATCEVRIGDVINPTDRNLYRQLAGGLTSANLLHGSANPIGGQNAVIKLRWGSGDDALKFGDAPPGVKFALGENVKQSNWGDDYTTRFPQTRPGVEAFFRERFEAARDYRAAHAAYENGGRRRGEVPPRRDLELDALVEILEGHRLLHCHSYRQDEILMLLRLADEFGFTVATFQHVLEGYKVADELAAAGSGASTFTDWWAYKFEVYDAIPYNGTLMAQRGVNVSFNSDSNEMARRMNLEAAKAIKYGGLDEVRALELVTINPARQLGIGHRVGSIEVGKDADLALWTASPLSTSSRCQQTWLDGNLYFDRDLDQVRAEAIEGERRALLDRAQAMAKAEDSTEEGDADHSSSEDSEGATPPESEVPAAEDDTSAKIARDTSKRSAAWSHRMARASEVDPRSPVTALVGGVVHSMLHAPVRGATILMADGVITAVGNDIPIPPGATLVDADALHILPGFFNANSRLGLVEIDAVRATRDFREVGGMNPQLHVDVSINPDSELFPVARVNGITHALTRPIGGLVAGQSAVIQLSGWTWEDMTLESPAGLHIQWPGMRLDLNPEAEKGLEEQREDYAKRVRELDEIFHNAQAYGKARLAHANGRGPRVDRDIGAEALAPVLAGEVPAIVEANDATQINAALDWATGHGLDLIILGGREAWRLAPRLAQEDVPVLLDSPLALPRRDWERYDTPYRNAQRLYEAGARFAITLAWDSNVRNLPYAAAMAGSFGLPREEVLRSITRYPAEILGVDDRLGSIIPGADASLVLIEGDPLDLRSKVRHVFIAGEPVPLESRHTRLWERYRDRPRRP